MSSERGDDRSDHEEHEDHREALAEGFDREIDPLRKHVSTFEHLAQSRGADPLKMFEYEVLPYRDNSPRTRESYRTTIQQWRQFMNIQNRHIACPNRRHVYRFIEYLRSQFGNADSTIKNKLWLMNNIFESWQEEDALPHSKAFNPFGYVIEHNDLEETNTREFHNITHEELCEVLQNVGNLRDLAIILTQLKLGLRATEVCNIKLKDIHFQHSELQEYYSELGSHPLVRKHPNSIFIPEHRVENKSKNDRLMPLDDEFRLVLGHYLTIRPDVDCEYLFLSKTGHTQMGREAVNRIWKKYIPERYLEDTERHRGITSHFGRHRFTTHWAVDNGFNRELVRYMRGDVGNGEAMDEYIHVKFEKIQDLYLNNVRKYLTSQ